MNNRLYFILGIIFFGGIFAESFVVESKKKKQQKIFAEDCCHQILVAHKTISRIDQYNGQIKGIELTWAEDFFDDAKNALLKLATQDKLQKCFALFQKHNAALERFEKELREIRDELKLIE